MLNVLRVSLRYIRFKCVKMFHRSTAGGFCDAEKSSHNSGNGNDDVVHISEWKDKATNAFVLLCKQTETRNTINVFVPLCCALITRNHQFLWSKWASFKHFTAIQYFGSAWNLSNEQEKKNVAIILNQAEKFMCIFITFDKRFFTALFESKMCALNWKGNFKSHIFFLSDEFHRSYISIWKYNSIECRSFSFTINHIFIAWYGAIFGHSKACNKMQTPENKKKVVEGPKKKFQLKWWKPNSKSRWPNDSYFLPMHFIARPFFNR